MTTQMPSKDAPHGRSRWRWGLILTLLVMGNSGASCSPGWRNPWASLGPPAPTLLATGASAPQIVAAVNQNTSRIHTYAANNATITVPGMVGPMLQGNIAIERPQRFRLRAGTALSGPEIDFGSNEQLFWFWVKRNVPPALYYTRHDQYATSAARQILPIEPSWLMDALGLITLDPAAAYEGPFSRSDGSLELRGQVATPSGPMSRVVVVNPTTAQVMEQHLYDPAGTLVASADLQRYRYDPINQVSLPERVSINVPQAQLSLVIDLNQIVVNQPIVDAQAFTLPTIEGFPAVDLSTMGPPPVATTQPTAAIEPAPPTMPSPYGRFRPPAIAAQPKPPISTGVVPTGWQAEGTAEIAQTHAIAPTEQASLPNQHQPNQPLPVNPRVIGTLPPNGVEF